MWFGLVNKGEHITQATGEPGQMTQSERRAPGRRVVIFSLSIQSCRRAAWRRFGRTALGQNLVHGRFQLGRWAGLGQAQAGQQGEIKNTFFDPKTGQAFL